MYKLTIKYKLTGESHWRQATYRSVTRLDVAEQIADAAKNIAHLDSLRIPDLLRLFHDTAFGGWVIVRGGDISRVEQRADVRDTLYGLRHEISNYVLIA